MNEESGAVMLMMTMMQLHKNQEAMNAFNSATVSTRLIAHLMQLNRFGVCESTEIPMLSVKRATIVNKR